MRELVLDGQMGASGDMLLGALLAAGADPSVLDPVEAVLDVRYEIEEVTDCGISATSVTVTVERTPESRHDDHHNEAHSHEDGDHDHEHTHQEGAHDDEHTHQDGAHDHAHPLHDERHAEGAGPHRTYPEVVELVESMGLPEAVENDALAIFELLGEAEAAVHGTDLESTQFHEVGADDAIADVVGVSLLLEDLEVDSVVTTPVRTGGGTVEMSHGIYPVPPPAVVELTERADWSVSGGPVETELLTPTGAAILGHLADGVETIPTLDVEAVGYGAGSKSIERRPNVLRALVGTSAGGLREEPITVLETHIDDATPEILGGLSDTLAGVGALDVTLVPTTMKKSRPGHLVKVVTRPEDAPRVARELARETGTLGVREHGSGHRFVAERTVESVTIGLDGAEFTVDVKIARFSGDDAVGDIFDVSCEYDDAVAVANTTSVPVRDVIERAESVARKSFEQG